MKMRGGLDESLNNFKAVFPEAMERAKEIEANLSPEHPSFIIVMERSHVSHDFFMCLPFEFSQKHIPKTDEIVVLEFENGQSYDVKLLGLQWAFSDGWEGLSRAEKLLENDILIFHLVEHCKFKVYIVRASGLAPVEKTQKTDEIVDCATDVEKKRTCESDKKRLRFVPAKFRSENVEESVSWMKKSICSDSKSSNMEGNNPKKSEKVRGSLDKSSNHLKASSAEVMERAKEIQESLCPEHPSFIKVLTKSYLSRPFFLLLPFQFYQKHLSRSNEKVVFEVESGRLYEVILLSKRRSFSGGWKRFFVSEKLQENDILVFHLVEPSKFKVYFVRASGVETLDKSPTVDRETATKKVEKTPPSKREKKRLKFFPADSVIKNSTLLTGNYSSNGEDFPPSQTISNFEDFKIVVDGTTIEFPEQVRVDYFKLCFSRKSYLHRQLIKGIDRELAASIISGMVNISNAIRESKMSTPQEDFASWHKTLDGFEVFGMDVGFIKARLNRLLGLTMESERYKEAKIERDRVVKEIIELEKVKRKLDDEIEGKKEVAAKFEDIYEEEATVPW